MLFFNVAHRNEVPDTEQRGGRKGAGNLRRLLRSIGRIPTFPPLGFDIQQYIPPTTFTFNRIGFLSCPHLKRIDIGYPLSKSGTLVEGAIVSFGTFSSLFYQHARDQSHLYAESPKQYPSSQGCTITEVERGRYSIIYQPPPITP